MSAAVAQDPSSSEIKMEPALSLPLEGSSFQEVVTQPVAQQLQSRRSSTSSNKRKRQSSNVDLPRGPFEFVDANEKPIQKRPRVAARAGSEKRNSISRSWGQDDALGAMPVEASLQHPLSLALPPVEEGEVAPPFTVRLGSTDARKSVDGSAAGTPTTQGPRPTAETADESNGSYPQTTPNYTVAFLGTKLIYPWYFSPYPIGEMQLQTLRQMPRLNATQGESQGIRQAKGQPKSARPSGADNGPTNGQTGVGTIKGHGKHDLPDHGSGFALYVCERCFVYSDRQFLPHQDCQGLQYNQLVYEDNGIPVEKVGSAPAPMLNGLVDAALAPEAEPALGPNAEPVPALEAKIPSAPEVEQVIDHWESLPDGKVSIYRVDPAEDPAQKMLCKNITLFGKMFIDSKSIVYDCVNFNYFIVTRVEEGIEFVAGFFTKEKECAENYNLACIITFPPYQKKGLGRLMIQFSYELSKYEGRIGSPEKPLSALGMRSYSPIWASMVLDYLYEQIACPQVKHLGSRKPSGPRRLGATRLEVSSKVTESGGAVTTDTHFICTLEEIATGAFLTASDASFALNELGLLKYITDAKTPAQADEDRSTAAAAPPVLTVEPNPDDSEALEIVVPLGLPMFNRDFIRLLAEKSRFRRGNINKNLCSYERRRAAAH